MEFLRRNWLFAGASLLAAGGLARFAGRAKAAAMNKPSAHFEVEHTEAQWRALLTPEQYEVCLLYTSPSPRD